MLASHIASGVPKQNSMVKFLIRKELLQKFPQRPLVTFGQCPGLYWDTRRGLISYLAESAAFVQDVHLGSGDPAGPVPGSPSGTGRGRFARPPPVQSVYD